MYLLEHDGKELLAAGGIPVPPGVLLDNAGAIAANALPAGPWVVKAQVPVGGCQPRTPAWEREMGATPGGDGGGVPAGAGCSVVRHPAEATARATASAVVAAEAVKSSGRCMPAISRTDCGETTEQSH